MNKDNILFKIADYKRKEVDFIKQRQPLSILERETVSSKPPSFSKALFSRSQLDKNKIAIIAEVKRASPSKGVIALNFDPLQLALTYQQSGAAAISVLTDAFFFWGDPLHLRRIANKVSIPILRKDFIIDPYQILEARMLGASAVLLIAAILSTEQLKEYLQITAQRGMDALVEIHCQEELDKALEADAQIIGINNRDLTNFEVKLETGIRLIKQIPSHKKVVAESGLKTKSDLGSFFDVGCANFLIGTSLITAGAAGDMAGVQEKLHSLLSVS